MRDLYLSIMRIQIILIKKQTAWIFIYEKIFFVQCTFFASTLFAATSVERDLSHIYHKDWIDFNKNGKKDVYEDSKATV